MSATPANKAAYLTATNTPLVIQPSPYPTLASDDSLIIKTKAVAINPVDTGIQTYGPERFTFITLPAILGYDVAGEVVAVGSGVTQFQVGDRVAGLAESALQEYVLLSEHLTVKFPDGKGGSVSLTWEEAATLPMGVSVSTKMLFDDELLGMKLPKVGDGRVITGETVLIWGGSTSMGSCAIQLAIAAGYEVITTASPYNFNYVKQLGASQVFDYNDPNIKDNLLEAFKGKTTAGAVANGGILANNAEIVEICAAVVKSCPGKQFVAMTMVPSWGPSFEGVELKFVEPLRGHKELASAIFHSYLPAALSTGAFKPAPQAEVVGHGLEAAQGALEVLRKGVSAKKIVITI